MKIFMIYMPGIYLTTTDPNECVNSLQFEIEEPPMIIAGLLHPK